MPHIEELLIDLLLETHTCTCTKVAVKSRPHGRGEDRWGNTGSLGWDASVLALKHDLVKQVFRRVDILQLHCTAAAHMAQLNLPMANMFPRRRYQGSLIKVEHLNNT